MQGIRPEPRDVMRATLAFLLLISFQAALAALMQIDVPTANRDMVIYMLGQLSGMVATAIAFYYSTSKSSVDKNKLLTHPHDGKAAPDDPEKS